MTTNKLKSQKWINEGGTYYPISGDTVLLDTPGPGIFNVLNKKDAPSLYRGALAF